MISILYKLLKYSGLYKLIQLLIGNNVRIVVYHNPDKLVFLKHLTYISKHYNIITLSELSDAISNGTFNDLPKRSVVITIDDGHKNNYLLLDLIKDFRIKPTIYLTSQIICTNRKFWTSIPNSLFEKEMLKGIPNSAKNQILLSKYSFSLNKEFNSDEREALNRNEILEMNPFVDFQSHTCWHPILTQCSDEEIKHELASSKQQLEDMLGKKIVHFCFPNGSYNQNVLSIARSVGYLTARSIDLGFANNKSNMFRLKVVGLSDKGTMERLALDLIGLPKLVIDLNNKLKKIVYKKKKLKYFSTGLKREI